MSLMEFMKFTATVKRLVKPTTLLTDTANSGQKTLKVESTANFKVGQAIKVGGEDAVVDVIDSATQMKVAVNLASSHSTGASVSNEAGIVALKEISAVKCDIQQMDAQNAALVGGVFGRAYKLFALLDQDIEIGDRVEADDKVFTVRGKVSLDEGTVGHLEVVLEEDLS